VNPLMTRYAERHQIARVMRTALRNRSDVMHECREDVSSLLFAFLTERMHCQMAITNPAPHTAIPLVLIIAACEVVIVSLHDFLVRLTVTAFSIREVRTACHAAGTFRLSRHCVSPFRHEKTSAGIAPIGGRAFKHTFHNTILPCQHWNSREL